jgi:hypothetical protein
MPHAERVHAGVAGRSVQEAQTARNRGMPVPKSSGEKGRAQGRWTHGGENGGMQVANPHISQSYWQKAVFMA